MPFCRHVVTCDNRQAYSMCAALRAVHVFWGPKVPHINVYRIIFGLLYMVKKDGFLLRTFAYHFPFNYDFNHIHIQNPKIFDRFGIFGTCRYFRQILPKLFDTEIAESCRNCRKCLNSG